MIFKNGLKGLLAAVTVFFTGATAHATETLMYTGLPFTSGGLAGTQVDVTVTVPVSSSYTGIASYCSICASTLTSFTISDMGKFDITAATATAYGFKLDLLNGVPVHWFVTTSNSVSDTAITTVNDDGIFGLTDSYDFARSGALVSFSPGTPFSISTGTWTVTGGVPEPGTWAFMVMGLGGIGGTIRARRFAKPSMA